MIWGAWFKETKSCMTLIRTLGKFFLCNVSRGDTVKEGSNCGSALLQGSCSKGARLPCRPSLSVTEVTRPFRSGAQGARVCCMSIVSEPGSKGAPEKHGKGRLELWQCHTPKECSRGARLPSRCLCTVQVSRRKVPHCRGSERNPRSIWEVCEPFPRSVWEEIISSSVLFM